MPAGITRPNFDEYFMRIALTVRSRANCMGRHVGAVLVKDRRIIATGYNGTPIGMPNCTEGGCTRCRHRDDKFLKGRDYDKCICVHAEQNAILQAARFGTAVDGAILYSTLQPCFGCAKEALQAGVKGIVYLKAFEAGADDPELAEQYKLILSTFPDGCRHLPLAGEE